MLLQHLIFIKFLLQEKESSKIVDPVGR